MSTIEPEERLKETTRFVHKKEVCILSFFHRLTVYLIGLVLIAYGIALTIKVSYLGVSAWDVLSLGLKAHFGLSVGTWNLIVGMLFVGVVLCIKPSCISFGTIGNVISIGPLVDVFMHLQTFHTKQSILFDSLVFVVGVVLIGIGGGLYVNGKFGAGPRDSFMLIICDKTNWDVAKVRFSMESVVFAIGVLLGGPIFIGTVVSTIVISYVFKGTNQIYNHWTTKRLHTKQALV